MHAAFLEQTPEKQGESSRKCKACERGCKKNGQVKPAFYGHCAQQGEYERGLETGQEHHCKYRDGGEYRNQTEMPVKFRVRAECRRLCTSEMGSSQGQHEKGEGKSGKHASSHNVGGHKHCKQPWCFVKEEPYRSGKSQHYEEEYRHIYIVRLIAITASWSATFEAALERFSI